METDVTEISESPIRQQSEFSVEDDSFPAPLRALAEHNRSIVGKPLSRVTRVVVSMVYLLNVFLILGLAVSVMLQLHFSFFLPSVEDSESSPTKKAFSQLIVFCCIPAFGYLLAILLTRSVDLLLGSWHMHYNPAYFMFSNIFSRNIFPLNGALTFVDLLFFVLPAVVAVGVAFSCYLMKYSAVVILQYTLFSGMFVCLMNTLLFFLVSMVAAARSTVFPPLEPPAKINREAGIAHVLYAIITFWTPDPEEIVHVDERTPLASHPHGPDSPASLPTKKLSARFIMILLLKFVLAGVCGVLYFLLLFLLVQKIDLAGQRWMYTLMPICLFLALFFSFAFFNQLYLLFRYKNPKPAVCRLRLVFNRMCKVGVLITLASGLFYAFFHGVSDSLRNTCIVLVLLGLFLMGLGLAGVLLAPILARLSHSHRRTPTVINQPTREGYHNLDAEGEGSVSPYGHSQEDLDLGDSIHPEDAEEPDFCSMTLREGIWPRWRAAVRRFTGASVSNKPTFWEYLRLGVVILLILMYFIAVGGAFYYYDGRTHSIGWLMILAALLCPLFYDMRLSTSKAIVRVFMLFLAVLGFGIVLLGSQIQQPAPKEAVAVNGVEYPFNPSLAYDICGREWTGLTVLDFAFMSKLAYFVNRTMLREQTEEWFPHMWQLSKMDVGPAQVYKFTYARAAAARDLGVDNLVVYSVRGTSKMSDWVEDLRMFFTTEMVTPIAPFLPTNVTTPLVQAFTTIQNGFNTRENYYYHYVRKAIKADVAAIKNTAATKDTTFYVTGHSLGAAIAKIVGASVDMEAITFSGPGLLYGRDIFGVTWTALNARAVNIIPRMDVVPKVGEQAGIVQNIDCTLNPISCHFIDNTACELRHRCSDPFDRSIRSVRCEPVLES
eukprot:GCRY01002541.1.p1 GENE.GCRY01002541.1~~GCRY01002541.1.p1  ORF type:complete len:886 (-),score=215.63 GCRY01002541.1:390-3047(-)